MSENGTNELTTTATAPMLPEKIGDQALLEALRAGGILKIETPIITAALRVLLADDAGYFDVPAKLLAAMDDRADNLSEPVGEQYYKVRAVVVQNTADYAELFQMIEGFNGEFASPERKRALLDKMRRHLWRAIENAFHILDDWRDSMRDSISDPALLQAFLVNQQPGATDQLGMNPLKLFTPPNADRVRDAVATLSNALNKSFAGTAIQITAALAYDAIRIKGLFDIKDLPKLAGFANPDEMRLGLGISASPEVIRTEEYLTRFVQGLLAFPEVDDDKAAMNYLNDLWTVGNQIDWDSLGC